GPCGGKTTGQSRLCTFFENLGWKVYRVPETATVLLSGGIKFGDLSQDDAVAFQENLLKSMMQIENTFFSLAETCRKNCLVICDRGTMDASAFIPEEQWEEIMKRNGWNPVDLRDTRYNQIIHMVSAANGAEAFYTTEVLVLSHSPHPCMTTPAVARTLSWHGSWTTEPLRLGLVTHISMSLTIPLSLIQRCGA
ncbi:hypothetical protein OTU49_011650, partial [Cherax quadricarinatus]